MKPCALDYLPAKTTDDPPVAGLQVLFMAGEAQLLGGVDEQGFPRGGMWPMAAKTVVLLEQLRMAFGSDCELSLEMVVASDA